MKLHATSIQLKDNAKKYLTGHYGLLIGTSLFTGLTSFCVSTFILSFTPSASTVAGFLLSNALSFLVSVFMGVFEVGTALIYLKFASGSTASFSDIFYGFNYHLEKSLKVSLILNVIGIIPTLAYSIPHFIYLQTGEMLFEYLMIPLTLIALVIYMYLSLGTSQSLFLMLDYPNKSASEILSLSFKVMKGNKRRLLYLEFSFFPIMLLAVVSCVGMLWVGPYMQMTYAAFFFYIMK